MDYASAVHPAAGSIDAAGAPLLSADAIEALVRGLYRSLLRREGEPEGMAAHCAALRHGATIESVIATFRASDEFRRRFNLEQNADLYPLDGAPPVAIDLQPSDAERQALWQRTAGVWAGLGETDPYWSVLTDDRYRIARMGQSEALDAFYATGGNEVARVEAWLARNGVAFAPDGHCIDYGCGVGRVSLWLSQRFRQLTAIDVSAPHVRAARAYLGSQGVTNVGFQLVRGRPDLHHVRGTDFFFSMLVLQHNPPPVMAEIVAEVLNGLNPGGLAFFQLPTYIRGYQFNAADYLTHATHAQMEMHMLPQSVVFQLADAAGCVPLEVQPDWLTGQWGDYLSNTFLFRKR